MAIFYQKFIDACKKQDSYMNFVGILPLKNYLAISRPEVLSRIKGGKATVEVSEHDEFYLFINLPLMDDSYIELRLFRNAELDEGDEVWISSIIALIFDNDKGETVLRYDAISSSEGKSLKVNDVKSLMIHRNTDLLMHSVKPVPMNLQITYECGTLQNNKGKIIAGEDYVVLYEINYISNIWKLIKLTGYTNAMYLSHGLILAESLKRKFDILNADGSVLCKDIDSLDYGPDYLVCNNRLWWYKKNNLWEEKIFNPYALNDFSQRMDKVNLSLKKIQFASDIYFYIYECEFWGERLIGDDDNPEWEPGYATSFMGLIDNNGSWVIPAAESVKEINRCHSIIIVNCENSVTLYDSKRKARGLFKEIITIDKCEIKYDKYLLLMKDSLQGVYDAEMESMEIPCCIDGKYTLKPNTIGNGMIGVSSIVDKKRGKHSWQEKKCYYLDYHGNVVLEINDGWVINSGFKDGKAIISMTDNYHGNYYERTIDIHGKVLEEEYESFPGEIEEFQRDDMRNLDRDNWDAMTDGQYGDYPDEGFDGDYEFMGR